MTEIQELRQIVQAQAKRITALERELEEQFRPGCAELENALTDARRDHELLVRLVVRMGEEFRRHRLQSITTTTHPDIVPRYDLTIASQREYDAAMHEAEGAPEGHGLVEDMQ